MAESLKFPSSEQQLVAPGSPPLPAQLTDAQEITKQLGQAQLQSPPRTTTKKRPSPSRPTQPPHKLTEQGMHKKLLSPLGSGESPLKPTGLPLSPEGGASARPTQRLQVPQFEQFEGAASASQQVKKILKQSRPEPLATPTHLTHWERPGMSPAPCGPSQLSDWPAPAPQKYSFTITYNDGRSCYEVTRSDCNVYRNIVIKPLEGDPEAGIFELTFGSESYFLKPGAKRYDEHNALVALSGLLGFNVPIAPVQAATIDKLESVHTITLYDASVVDIEPEEGETCITDKVCSLQKKITPKAYEDLNPNEKINLLLTCIIFGIGDVKDEDIVGGQIVDCEECMATILESRPSTHLPLLMDTFFHENLDQVNINRLKKIADCWNIDTILSRAQEFKAEHFDQSHLDNILEKFETYESDDKDLLHGAEVEEISSSESPLFSNPRIEALKTRLGKIKKFIIGCPKGQTFSMAGLVFFLDPKFKRNISIKSNEGKIKELIAELEAIPEKEKVRHLIYQLNNYFAGPRIIYSQREKDFIKLLNSVETALGKKLEF